MTTTKTKPTYNLVRAGISVRSSRDRLLDARFHGGQFGVFAIWEEDGNPTELQGSSFLMNECLNEDHDQANIYDFLDKGIPRKPGLYVWEGVIYSCVSALGRQGLVPFQEWHGSFRPMRLDEYTSMKESYGDEWTGSLAGEIDELFNTTQGKQCRKRKTSPFAALGLKEVVEELRQAGVGILPERAEDGDSVTEVSVNDV